MKTSLIKKYHSCRDVLEKVAEHLNDMGCEHETSEDGLAEKCIVCMVNHELAKK